MGYYVNPPGGSNISRMIHGVPVQLPPLSEDEA